MRVITKDEVKQPFVAPMGELIYELIGEGEDLGGATKHSFAHVVVPSGKLSPVHYHKVSEETYYILQGQADMVIDGQAFTLSSGQTLLILPNEVHQVANNQDEALEFLVVCAPPWTENDFFIVDE